LTSSIPTEIGMLTGAVFLYTSYLFILIIGRCRQCLDARWSCSQSTQTLPLKLLKGRDHAH
jgi:hypothetical protein